MRGKRAWAGFLALAAVVLLAAPAAADTPLQTDLTVEATSSAGAVVSYPEDGKAADGCTPASGSTFALGATNVTCTIPSDFAFTVNVVDTTKPALGPLADVTAEAASTSVTTVNYPDPAASDLFLASVGCAPSSGSAFPFGSTVVTCTATDTSGNSSSASFNIKVVDTTSPVLGVLPDPGPVEATSHDGAVVTFATPSASDLFLSGVSCSPASGSTFPLGSTPVTCTATDTNGNSSSGSFTVRVVDTSKPVLGPPPSPSPVEATSRDGAVVTFASPTASDLFLSGVGCSPGAGSTFPLGSTTVTCTATDTNGNSSSTSFNVIVRDTTKPVLGALPVLGSTEATSNAGAVVTYTAPSATDIFPVSVVCTPASGSVFALGATLVTCTAKDTSNNTSSGSFTGTVKDTKPPVIAVPAPITVTAPDSGGATVLYAATSVDVVDGPVSVACLPASGATFPVGVTAVTCNAADAARNAATPKSFTITVKAPPSSSLPAPSPPTTTAPFLPPTNTKPATVTGLSAKPGNRRVVLTWGPPSAGQHVELSRSTGGGRPTTVYTGSTTTFIDAGLRNGVRYSYVIVAIDKDGNRSQNATLVATPQALRLVSPAPGARVGAPPTLVWVPVAKAAYYNVQLFRDGKKLLSIWPGANRLRLKRKWFFAGKHQSLVPGTYTWFVWPGFGPHKAQKYGGVLGNSSFQLSG